MHEQEAIASAVKSGRKIVVGGFATDSNGRVLLVQRSAHEFMANSWEIPSGGVEPGENFVEALTREFLEETGLTIRRVGSYVNYFDYGSSRQFNYVVDVDPSEQITLSDEHQQFAWLHAHEADLDAPMRRLVEEFFERFSSVR